MPLTEAIVVNLLLLFLVVIWLALVWWTYADAKRRIDDPIDAAGCQHAAVGPAQGGTPAAAGPGFEKLNRGFVAIRRLAFDATGHRFQSLPVTANLLKGVLA